MCLWTTFIHQEVWWSEFSCAFNSLLLKILNIVVHDWLDDLLQWCMALKCLLSFHKRRESIAIKLNKSCIIYISYKMYIKKIPLKQAKKKLHLTLYYSLLCTGYILLYPGRQITFVIIHLKMHSILMRMKQLSIVHLHQ